MEGARERGRERAKGREGKGREGKEPSGLCAAAEGKLYMRETEARA
jgi:hypothetical protein